MLMLQKEWSDSCSAFSHSESIVKCFVIIQKARQLRNKRVQSSWDKAQKSLQFQKREIRIAVISLVFALLYDVFLKCGGGFGVVPVEAI